MITDAFDNKTEPIVTLTDLYGDGKKLIDICLVTFSKVIYDELLKKFQCEKIGEIREPGGNIIINKFNYDGLDIGFYITPIGSSCAAQAICEANHMVGATKFIMFGSCGSLDSKITSGKYIIPSEAYREEGMSYHYMEPTDYITIHNAEKVSSIFKELNIPFVRGRVWTTDALLMETKGKLEKRKSEGCIAVEMEIAGVEAVSRYYNLEVYDFLESGDVLLDDSYISKGLVEANHNLDKVYIAIEIAKRI